MPVVLLSLVNVKTSIYVSKSHGWRGTCPQEAKEGRVFAAQRLCQAAAARLRCSPARLAGRPLLRPQGIFTAGKWWLSSVAGDGQLARERRAEAQRFAQMSDLVGVCGWLRHEWRARGAEEKLPAGRTLKHRARRQAPQLHNALHLLLLVLACHVCCPV